MTGDQLCNFGLVMYLLFSEKYYFRDADQEWSIIAQSDLPDRMDWISLSEHQHAQYSEQLRAAGLGV